MCVSSLICVLSESSVTAASGADHIQMNFSTGAAVEKLPQKLAKSFLSPNPRSAKADVGLH